MHRRRDRKYGEQVAAKDKLTTAKADGTFKALDEHAVKWYTTEPKASLEHRLQEARDALAASKITTARLEVRALICRARAERLAARRLACERLLSRSGGLGA